MKLKRGPSRFWSMLFRLGFARPRMPFWRVVVEARLNRTARRWPARMEGAVTAVFVWARTIEEAEALATLALDAEGLDTLTADAIKCPPAAAPQTEPAAIARGELRFLPRLDDDARSEPPSHRGARA